MSPIPPPNVPPQVQAAFKENHAEIIQLTVARLLSRAGRYDHLGGQAENVLASGFEFTSSSLEACLLINDASLLMDQLRWSKDRLPHDGISIQLMQEGLAAYAEVIGEVLPGAQSIQIVNLLHRMIAEIEH